MSRIADVRRAASLGGSVTLLMLELSKAAMVMITQRDASRRAFRKALAKEDLPAEAIEELAEAYDGSLIRLREIVRSSANW